METEFTVTADFDAVYLINGAFVENAVFRFDPHDVLYITVLPLAAHLLPYTVKIAQGAAHSNGQLVVCVRLGDGYYIRLRARYAYAFAPGSKPEMPKNGAAPCRLFSHVKSGQLPAARALMTPELSGSVTDDDLAAFFDEYTDILEIDGRFYLVRENVGVPFVFSVKNGLVDNIEEVG